ncbi:MAG: Ribosomal RNA small subunit methyltransferase I [Candidatus Magasanikbacteria bacterium GW2011_GWC2_45_8]|uniref:Ribosomal RNA small subunit methyltransferase I n=1 Tax=Candidatus Magasanikbacteria bacterium GW2011_GWC2_45_8 TaxID=1619050 RepID=A0A0G1MZ61_9BACT|nr:MAG: Ribosomal RNA small subunit methyltransferase I [Candidatus Magasanikbacteria bacterium GW2011_GWC2_45_8]
MAKLYLVATPIGNLKDITLRALEILKTVDVVLCEDTRTTRKLLSHYDIHTPTRSFHQHTSALELRQIKELLAQDKTIALVTDAGTPCISDPGNMLIQSIIADSNLSSRVAIHPIPGASALITLISVAGLPADEFTFLGFVPVKKHRAQFFKMIDESPRSIVCYESTHRIIKTLEELQSILTNTSRRVCVGRELTKQFETLYRGTVEEVLQQLKAGSTKGEFVIMIAP